MTRCPIPLKLLALILPTGAVTAQSTPLGHHMFCPPGIEDAAGAVRCIGASSVPQVGKLYPLGPDFYVSKQGRVGIGTTGPATAIDVRGTGGGRSTLRLQDTGLGASGIVLQRPGGTPADWLLSYDAGASSDFVIHDTVAAKTRLRIDEMGRVEVERLDVGDVGAGLQFRSTGLSLDVRYGPAGGSASSTQMIFEPDQIRIIEKTVFTTGVVHGPNSSIQFQENELLFPSPPMIFMFEDDTSNLDRMVLAHSTAFDDWGLRYDDDEDAFHFLAAGAGVMTVKLSGGGRVGIGASNPANILTVQQNSPTDPVADAWTTYSSRRWKENVAPIEDALATVRRLRGVTFDWRATGEHDLGMVAEEVGEVLPELVAYEENGRDAQSIDYARLSAVLVEAIKEQDALLEQRTEEVRELRRAVEGLLDRVAALEDS